MTVSEAGGRAVLQGVVSWGKHCAREEWPGKESNSSKAPLTKFLFFFSGVYARVDRVLDWIESNTRDSRFCGRKRRLFFDN